MRNLYGLIFLLILGRQRNQIEFYVKKRFKFINVVDTNFNGK